MADGLAYYREGVPTSSPWKRTSVDATNRRPTQVRQCRARDDAISLPVKVPSLAPADVQYALPRAETGQSVRPCRCGRRHTSRTLQVGHSGREPDAVFIDLQDAGDVLITPCSSLHLMYLHRRGHTKGSPLSTDCALSRYADRLVGLGGSSRRRIELFSHSPWSMRFPACRGYVRSRHP